MKHLIAVLSLAVICAGAAQALGQRAPATLAGLPQVELRVITARGEHKFQVWIAENEQSRAQGLMFIKELAANQGMLFLFDRPRFTSFWMKNTYLSLDIIFIDPAGLVVNVAKDTTPLSIESVESAAPVTAVLELNAGTAERIGLKARDRIRFVAPHNQASPPPASTLPGS